MDIFYVHELGADSVILDPGESYHCLKVLRNQIGDKVNLTDGRGWMGIGEIIIDNPKKCEIRVDERIFYDNNSSYSLNIAIAPVKNRERFEWFLEKATEIGITSVQPIFCERSERKSIRIDRLENVIISAMKQSLRAYKPVIHEPMTFYEWIDNSGNDAGYIAHCMDGYKEQIWKLPLLTKYDILIGPEGDFSPKEVEYAINKGLTPITMGEARLRTETAGLIACSAINFINKR